MQDRQKKEKGPRGGHRERNSPERGGYQLITNRFEGQTILSCYVTLYSLVWTIDVCKTNTEDHEKFALSN